MLDDFKNKLKIKFSKKDKTLEKDFFKKISIKDLTVCKFYQKEVKMGKILKIESKENRKTNDRDCIMY